jgi:hypothetical protein
MIVQIPGSTARTNLVCREVPIKIHEVWFYANLIVLGEKGLEVILGMNWMSTHKGHIDCERKAIRITSSEDVEVEHVSTLPSFKVLCNKSIVEPSLKQVPVVKEYRHVFLEELPGMPLIRISSCRAGRSVRVKTGSHPLRASRPRGAQIGTVAWVSSMMTRTRRWSTCLRAGQARAQS